MQITVVEAPGRQGNWNGSGGDVRSAEGVGLWASPKNEGGDISPRESGVFPSLRAMGEMASANDVWRWVPPSVDSPEGCVRLVVFQRGATWPPFLARDLSGGATTCIVPEVLGDGLSGLVQRVARRAGQVNLPVAQLIWISDATRRGAPIRFVRQLADLVAAETTVLVVQSQPLVPGRRASRRRTSTTESNTDAVLRPWTASAVGS